MQGEETIINEDRIQEYPWLMRGLGGPLPRNSCFSRGVRGSVRSEPPNFCLDQIAEVLLFHNLYLALVRIC